MLFGRYLQAIITSKGTTAELLFSYQQKVPVFQNYTSFYIFSSIIYILCISQLLCIPTSNISFLCLLVSVCGCVFVFVTKQNSYFVLLCGICDALVYIFLIINDVIKTMDVWMWMCICFVTKQNLYFVLLCGICDALVYIFLIINGVIKTMAIWHLDVLFRTLCKICAHFCRNFFQ